MVLSLFAVGYSSTHYLTEAKGIWLPFSFQTGITALIFLYMGEIIRENMSEIEQHKGAILIGSMCVYAYIIYNTGVAMVGNSYGMSYVSIIGAFFGTMVWIFAAKGLVHIPFISQGLEWIGKRTGKFLVFHLAELNFMPWHRILSIFLKDTDSSPQYLCNIYVYIHKILFNLTMVGVVELLWEHIKKELAILKQK